MKNTLLILILYLLFIFLFILSHNFNFAQGDYSFVPQRIKCTPLTIFEVLRGAGVPAGLLSRCLLYFTQKILTLLYTFSLFLSIGFIIYGGITMVLQQDFGEAKKYVLWAAIGAVVTILAFSLVKAIEFSLTR
jgi:hypothetical protein